MESQNGLNNPLTTELQPHLLVQPDIFTVDSQKPPATSLFSVDERLIKDVLSTANEWKIATERFTIGTVPNAFGEGVENAWVNTGSVRNTPLNLDPVPFDSLFARTQPPAVQLAAAKASVQIAQGKALAVSQIQDFLNRPDRLEQFKIAFGRDLDRATIERVIGEWQTDGNKIPDIEIVSSQTLGKADGGFDTVNNKIYLSSNLIERGNSAEIVPVIIEEIGHYLDSKIHPGGDAAGDEGEIFAKLVRGVNISDAEYVTLINEDDRATIILNNNPITIEQSVTTAYAIKAEKTVSFNGNSDLDGNPLDLSDDALVYGGMGFSLKGNSVLPVKYDASNNPLQDSQGKLVLVDKAITVSAAYLQANVSGNASNKYAGLTPPQIVAAEIVTVPLFADLKQQELNLKIAIGTSTTTFNIGTNPINNLTDWAQKFPAAGTATVPKVVRVTGGGLNIPININLSNYVIIVDSGDINVNGTSNLSNVTLVANNGNINLNSVQSDNLSALANGAINHNSSARFGGDTLLANGSGNITFNGATKGITTTDRLRVVSAGGITFNGAQSTRGSFVSQGDFISNGSADIYGTVSSKQNITFNGALTFTYANIRDYSDNNPPAILANLVNDSGTSNSDKITNDGQISGTISDTNQIIEFKAGFDSQPLANFNDVLSSLNSGSFSFTKAQLETIYGGTIPDGSHTLNLIATDKYGNRSSVYPYTFALDTTTPVPTLNLAATSDTGVVGDDRTKSPLVTLTGQVEANARVLLSGNPTPVTADNLGNYTFENVALSAGNNSFTVTATDIAGNQQTYSRAIYRTSPPTAINLATSQVLENSADNTIVGGLSTIDPDGVDSYAYTLVDDAGGRFKLVDNKIKVANGSLLDFEVNTLHQIQVRTTDGEGDSYLQSIAISVLNVNESPTSLTLSNNNLAENTGLNGIIGTFTSADPDLGDTRTYTLISGLGDIDNSQFTIVGDRLQLKPNSDFETKSSYQLRARVTDAGGLSYERALTINITDVNEAPTALNITNTSLAENASVGTIFGDLSAIDLDANETQTFSLVSGTGDTNNSSFSIVGTQLVINNSPDFEAQNNYSLRVRVSDRGGLTFERVLSINVTDVNEAPTAINLSGNAIAENSNDNSTIGILTTIDPDAVDTASYNLTDDANGRFKLFGNELKVANGSLLDFEANTQYQITLSSTDRGGFTFSRQFNIQVTNVNEIPTGFSLSNSTVAENTPLGGVVGSLSTIDPDVGDTHTYTLVNGTGSGDNSAFAITNNQLKFLVSPNFETKSNYSLRVRTTDAGGLNIDKVLTVNITNINEAPTQLVLDTTSVAENSPIGTLVGKFTTTDPDVGDPHTYSLVTGNGSGDNAKFTLAGNELRLNVSPDFETQSVYYLRVQTADAGGLTWEQELTVGITDVNESAATTLIEGTSFNKQLNIPITIPATGGKLSFKLAPLQFDGTDLKGINDALEVILVDAQGKSLVTPFQAGRDAFFNWTEGESVITGDDASYDSVTGIVTLNLTGVTPGSANLVFRLLNNDTDTTTTVTLSDLTLLPNSPTPQLPNALTPILSSTPTPVSPTFFNTATDVSASIIADYHRTSFNEGNKELDVNVALKNQGSYGLNGTLLVVVKSISNPSVSVKNADGFTPEGLPYYTFTASNGKLDPTQVTSEQTLVFKNLNGVQFSYDLMVLSEINAAPVIKSSPELEVIGGKNYQYQVQAEDPNGDSLSYKLLSAPNGMAIDPSTGLMSWNTSAGEVGNYQLAVEVSDGRGGIAEQNYNLAVITPPPNRPPVFTSNPLVDANINSEYKYQATAKDLDGDLLTFSLVNKPIGMVIDANTGVIKWTPNSQQLGNYDVTVKVDDGKGAIANQVYKVSVGNAVGNNAPIITSTPITEFGIIGTTNGAATANLQTIIRDFRMSGTPNGHPDFQRFLGSVTGMVSSTLGSDGTPVFIKPSGVGATSATTFAQWYRDVPGVNQRVDVPLTLTETTPGSGIWQYQNGSFFPIDNLGYGNQGYGHNFAFTVETHTNFTYKGGEVFNFTGDDDVWVFINNKLVIDLGGTHSPLSASVALDTLGLTKGKTYAFDLFSAERYTDGSSLRLQTSIDFGSEYFYQVKADDVETALLKYELVQAPTGMQIDPSGLISWRPKLSQQNTYPIIIKVTDGQGGIATQSFALKVIPSNPGEIRGTVYRDANGNATKNIDEIGLQGRTVYIDENLDGRRNLDEVSATTDVNGSYVFKTLPSGAYKIAIENQSGWNITGGTGAVILGNGQILNNLNIGLLEAKDPSQNQNPYFVSTPPTSQIEADKVFKYQVKAQDPDGDGLNYSLVNSTFSGIDIDPNTGLIAWQPNQAQIGRTFDSLIQVKDAYGGIAQQSFQFKVVAANTAPIFTNAPLNPIAATVNNPVEYQFRAIDADNDPISYRIVNPANALGATINSQTGVFAWATASRSLGSYNFTLGATDGKGLETLQNFTVALQNLPNLSPVIASTPRKQTPVGQNYVYQIAATDPNSDPLTYNLINPPAGMNVNNRGLLTWTPTAAQLGQSSIQIQVSDGRGGVTSQQFDLDVVNFGNLVNNNPEITSTPTFTTNLGKTYSYQLTGTDSDNDTLVWSLDNAPTGMVIDSKTGILKWNPSSTQIGNQTIAVRLSDAYGLYVGQEYTLKVNGVNTPPQIQSTPNTIAGVNSPYKYQVKAVDAEGDAIQYTLGRRPTGMVVDSNTGLITWTPIATQIGTQIIDLLVTDIQGAVTTQTYNLVVGSTLINQAPTIISIPKFAADINSKYQYQIVATDPETSQLTYALATAPTGMVIDANTGLVTWDNPTLGNTNIKITATDTSGAVAVQEYTLTGKQNRAPVINSTPPNQVTLGNTYRYDVVATDSDNDALTYSLDNASKLAGVSIDNFGRVAWKPTTVNLGIKPVTVTVTDALGATVTQTYNLEVLADNIAPSINLVRGTNIADIGETISFQVQATDNVGIKSKQLLIDNQAVPLDSNGVGTYKVTTAGVVTATAIVTDLNGNTSTKNTTVNVIDPTDVDAPNISLNLSGITNGIITGRTDIIGTVTDTNLDYYTLEVARWGTDNWQEVFKGTTSITNGTLGKFDPSLLENDSYRVRLTAYDTSGRGSQIEDQIDVTGDLKLGNFRLSFTDLTIPVTGIPISLTRTYDSLTSGTTDDFGYGWRMEFRDTDLRTSLKADPYYEQLDYRTVGFNFGTRIYITLPGGKREGFTFQPQQVQGALGGLTGGRLFYPSFVSDKGVTSTLTVPGAEIKANTNIYSANAGTSSGNPNGVLLYKEGKLFNLAGRPYVPQDDGFGNRYILTTKDGTQYEINATTGDLESVTDTNGNTLTYSDTAIVSSTGVKVTFERDNQGRITSVTDPLGQKVQYGYDAKGDLVSVKDRDGNETKFGYNATRSHYLDKIVDPLGREAVKTEYDELGRLKKTSNAGGNGVEFVYNPENSIQTVEDALGNATTYEYDVRGNVVTEVDALGGIIRRTYDDDSNLLSETDAEGSITKYTYDRSGNPISITDPLNNTIYYTYNEQGQVVSRTNELGNSSKYTFNQNGKKISYTNSQGVSIFYGYDARGGITSITDANDKTTSFNRDQFGNFIRYIDNLGNQTTATYDNNGNKLTETIWKTTAQGLKGLTTQYKYDANNNAIESIDSQGNIGKQEYDSLGNTTAIIDPLGHRTEYAYNSQGKLELTTYADGTSERYIYDVLGHKISSIDRAGNETRYVYDALGRQIKTIYPDATPDDLSDNPTVKNEYTKTGRILAKVDERGYRTQYEYNAGHYLTAIIDPLLGRTSFTYDAIGNKLTETDTKGNITKFVYNDLGKLVKTIFADGNSTSMTYDRQGRKSTDTDHLGIVTTTEYDDLDRVTKIFDSFGNATINSYDSAGKLITTTNALGNTTTYGYDDLNHQTSIIDALGATTSLTYDAVGNQKSVTDALGRTTQYNYDVNNRLTATYLADGSIISTTYDANGLPILINQMGMVTKREYNRRGELTAVIDALNQRTTYNYDLSGNRIGQTDANSHTTTYEYDALNRQTATIFPGSQRSTNTYDAIGNLTAKTDANGRTINYQYDRVNRQTSETWSNGQAISYSYTPAGQLAQVTDSNGLTKYAYDAQGRLIGKIDSNSKQIQYTYDALDRRTSMSLLSGTTGYTYDKVDRLTSVSSPDGGLTSYSYDLVGNLIQTKLPNQVVETRTYDRLNRLIQLTDAHNSDILSSYTYTLDGMGNRTKILEQNGNSSEYVYDGLSRLVQETIKNPTTTIKSTSYIYDAVGNRLSQSDSTAGITTYTYDLNDRLLTEIIGGQTTAYTYDNNGNTLAKITSPSERTNYTWDEHNRLITADIITSTGTNHSNYRYDSRNLRVASIVDGVETRYLIDDNRSLGEVVEEYSASNSLLTSYVRGNDLISQTRDTGKYFYSVDGLGSTRILTNESGQVTDTYNYDAFGQLLNSTGSTANNYRYTGEQYDSNLNQYYLRERYYDPGVGRFTRMDTFGGFDSEPLSLNKYLYANGNPVMNVDPSGLFVNVGEAVAALAVFSTLLIIADSIGRYSQYRGAKSSLVPADLAGKGNQGVDELYARTATNAQEMSDVILIREMQRTSRIKILLGEMDYGNFPIVVWGGSDIYEAWKHDADAISSGKDSFLRRIRPPWSRSTTAEDNAYLSQLEQASGYDYSNITRWYNVPARPFTPANPCAFSQVGGGSEINPYGKDCDEYPYASTLQGGRVNFYKGGVSLRFINSDHNRDQGTKLLQFFGGANISGNNIKESENWFFVGISRTNNSYGVNRNGNTFPLT